MAQNIQVNCDTDRAETRVSWFIIIALIVSTAFFTVLHHGFPSVLDVPSTEGVPYMDYPSMFVMDIFTIGLALLCLHHAHRRLGIYRAMIFLGGSFVFTGIEESMWILLGRYHEQIQNALGVQGLSTITSAGESISVGGTYYFTRGFFWFLETPVSACVGWFFLAYSCVYMAELLIPKANIVWRAALGGFLAMDVDLWLDPVQTSKTFISWVWVAPDAINIFSIPLSNFIGWFLLIFLFALVFDKLPVMVKTKGPVRAAIRFYGILMALEIAILLFFMIYGGIAMRLFPHPINLTIWGI